MKPSHLRRFHTQGWMAMQDGVHLGSNFLREAAMNVAPGTRNGPVGELLVVVQAVAGSSPVAHPSGSPGKPGVFCCARPNRRGARGTNEVPILPANAASEGFLRAVRSQFPATRRPVEWLPLPHSRERVAQRVPARSTPNEAQIATGATGQATCRTSAWWTRPTLPGLLTRAEIGSYRPDWGLCDSLTRKRKPGAALAADCQKTVAECEYPRTATDRRHGLMADPKRVVERHVEAFNARDVDAEPWSADGDLVAPNASMHGREQVLGFLGVFWEAFPDGRLETTRLIAEGSVVAAEGRFTGTHTGVMHTPAGDVAATGRQVDLRWMSSYEVRGDELASEHLYFDQADLLGQLGLMPAT